MGKGRRIVANLALVACSSGLAVGLSLIALEVKLERDAVRLEEEQYDQVRPYYSYSFNTHDGVALFGHRGKLQIALHPFAGYANLPNQSTKHFSINSRGLRGPEVARDKGGRKRIAVVGGSSAFGTGLASDDDTFEVQLGRLLNAEVLNGGVIGHQSGQELVLLLTELVELQPDLVIAYDGWNDYESSARAHGLYGVSLFKQFEAQVRFAGMATSRSGLAKMRSVFRLFFPRSDDWINRSSIPQNVSFDGLVAREISKNRQRQPGTRPAGARLSGGRGAGVRQERR